MREERSILSIRNLILLLVLIGFTWVVVTRFASLPALVHRLIRGDLPWILAAVIVHIIYFYLQAVVYHFCLKLVGVHLPSLKILPVVFVTLFINAIAPTGGIGGAAVFIDYAVRNNQRGVSTAVGVLLTLMADLSTLSPFVLVGLVSLEIHNQLKFYEWLGFLFLMIFVVGMIVLLILAYRRRKLVAMTFKWFQSLANKAANKITRRNWLPEEWAESNSAEFHEGARAIASQPWSLAWVLFLSTVMHMVNLVGLYFFFLAYKQSVDIGTLVAAFGLGIVFFVIAIVPEGVGAVEGIMSLVFISMGIPRTNAAVISLAFRGVNFWLPIIVGFFSFHAIGLWSGKKKEL